MATEGKSTRQGLRPRDEASLLVALTDAPNVLPVLTDEVALIVLHLGADLAAILDEDH
ncbi:hypothetical protein [Sphingomonas koreensis]|mgnify:CR=1 FL=1|jgi:hypothetical protein|uniref:hypothetical protein n=1 Tax=Sphingomonas koreensis TaxID=93064 RepID=UPI0013DE79F4|nr:hypothetical protein [Sphingomonas koreensis]